MCLRVTVPCLMFVILMRASDATHYRGGIITWRPLNTTPSGNTVQVLIRQKHSWRRNYTSVLCNDVSIATGQIVLSGTGSVACYTGGSCPSFTTLSADVYCTDYSIGINYSSGEEFNVTTLPLNGSFTIAFGGGNWMALAIGGNANWTITGRIDLRVRPDGILNTSPVTTTLPVIYKTIGVQHVHVVQMSDADNTDTLRCRWSTNNIPPNWNNYDECNSVCAPSLPLGYTLIAENCTIVFTLNAANFFAVALQIEDFYTPTSPTPMSSVPIQFLFYGYYPPSGCSTAPTIIGVRPNLACIGTPIGLVTNETVIAQIGCPGKTIIDFVTSSPIGLTKSLIQNPSTGIYTITLTWIPTADQYGPQGFCAAAVDDTNVQSDTWCITFLVGFTPPDLQKPLLVQSSASPLGTVFSNHRIFSIQSVNGIKVNRPGRNGTYIYFRDATLNNSVALKFDCGWSPNVIYSGSTILIDTAPFVWTPGHFYYVTLDSGASSGNDFCHAESAPLNDPNFWRYNIWNPALSSTTTTSTTPPTTATVTTRGPSTTTPIANLTTTGIVIISSTPGTTTTITTATTSPLSTTILFTVAPTTTLSDVNVVSPSDFEEACKQPVAICTAASMLIMAVVHAVGMFATFTHVESMFNPDRIAADQRRQAFRTRLAKGR